MERKPERYMVIDIETAPNDHMRYSALPEEEKTNLLNPIDSRVVAIGVRHLEKDLIFDDADEKELLERFWDKWREITGGDKHYGIVGFNIKNFDLPFIVNRSFIHGVTIQPFTIKPVIDIREKVNAYKYGKTRGKLKEYAAMLGLPVMDVDGSDVADLHYGGERDKIAEYLRNDLLITDSLYQRLVETKIVFIDRW